LRIRRIDYYVPGTFFSFEKVFEKIQMILGPQVTGKANSFIRALEVFIVNVFLKLGLANYLVRSFMEVYVD
jgi:hypothetical protein